MTDSTEIQLVPTSLPQSKHITPGAAKRAVEMMPVLAAQIRAFDRHNTQSTLAFMSLTMLNGQSPYRLLRQVLAESEDRMLALSEAQVTHAEMVEDIAKLEKEPPTPINEAKLRNKRFHRETIEGKINGTLKDIAVLADAYEAIKAKHGITEWGEADAEAAEKLHHIRRGFELLYRNIVEVGHAKESALEYLQQYGVHPQLAIGEVVAYIRSTDDLLNSGERLTAAHLEHFLDQIAEKYRYCADIVSERIFGKAEFANSDYMMRNVQGRM